jgi:hypothetical protein
MPNNTPTYWSASGESLHTYARSIESLGPGLNVPLFRGEDIVIPGRNGRVWTPKDVDSRILPLGMWVRGSGDDQGTGTTSPLFHTNWNNLVRLLWTPDGQFPLTKRFYDGDSTLRSATALAEFSSGLAPTMSGKNAAKTLVDLELADPYFYDDVVQNFPLVNGDNVINVRGNAPTRNIMVTINGSRRNTIIRRKLPTVDHQFQVTTDLSSGDFIIVNVAEFEASLKRGTNPVVDATVDVRHTGAIQWLELKPGNNTITVSSDVGLGTIQMQVRGAWV